MLEELSVMVGLYVLLGIAVALAVAIVVTVVILERKRKPMKWESYLIEDEEIEKEFDEIWGELNEDIHNHEG